MVYESGKYERVEDVPPVEVVSIFLSSFSRTQGSRWLDPTLESFQDTMTSITVGPKGMNILIFGKTPLAYDD